MTIGEYIQHQRTVALLTRPELAKKMGTSAGYIQRIESGAVNPSERMIYKLADALGQDPDTLCQLAGIIPSGLRPWVLAHLSVLRKVITAEANNSL